MNILLATVLIKACLAFVVTVATAPSPGGFDVHSHVGCVVRTMDVQAISRHLGLSDYFYRRLSGTFQSTFMKMSKGFWI